MRISFIVTTYNIEHYIGECLKSVFSVARAGDEIIIIDDGSKDSTLQVIKDLIRLEMRPADVDVRPIFLGTNTMGGVGVAANIGLDAAACDCIFFVDGDDWLHPMGFDIARDKFEADQSEMLIVNYQEFDDSNGTYKKPADDWRWPALTQRQTFAEKQLNALKMIAVPWRKFYRRSLLQSHKLRFPEGDFFFEDNPFHWSVCLAANSIEFLDTTLCYHRINRPGQTMASTGVELIAFLDHFVRIQSTLPSEAPYQIRAQAVSWLIGNLSWHLTRLQPEAAHLYIRRAGMIVDQLDSKELSYILDTEFPHSEVSSFVSLLKERGWGAALEVFLINSNRKQLEVLHSHLRDLIADTHNTSQAKLSSILDGVTTLRNIAEYETIYNKNDLKG